mgnify:CR=1 FL=1
MAKRDSSKHLLPADLPPSWTSLLRLIPGYDSISTAGASWFDADTAQLALDFFPECLRHVEGELAGKPFVLEPWEQAIIANLFGWWRTDPQGRQVRRYREGLVYVPRKNGKSPLGAGIALFVFFADPEKGQQNYIAAADKEQAGYLFRHARGMVEAEPSLSSRCRIYGGNAAAGQARSIYRKSDQSFVRVISADADTKHGGNTHLALVDELHAQPDRELVDVLQTSIASLNRKSPLLLYLTTADFMRPSICNEKYDYACKVRDGILVDPAFLPVIYEATKEEDWTSPATWAKANPNLGISVSQEYLARECERAKDNPAYENTFKRLHLNLRTEQDVRAIPMDHWDRCGQGADPIAWRREMLASLRGERCMGGLDLGATSDLTALALLFGDEPPFVVLPFFWVPRGSATKRTQRDRLDYTAWIAQGFVTATEGDVTDYDKVRADLNDLGSQFLIEDLAVDRLFQGAQLCTQLMHDGFNVVAFGQGFFSMAAPCKQLLELVTGAELLHGNNPVLRWNASNTASESDATGNLKWSKKRSTEKIDGIVAATMALGRAMLREHHSPSITAL